MDAPPDYFTLWNPFDSGAPMVLRVAGDGLSHQVNLDGVDQAWDAFGLKASDSWTCSSRLAAALDGHHDHVGPPTDAQAGVLYSSLFKLILAGGLMGSEVFGERVHPFMRMPAKHVSEGVTLLKMMAKLHVEVAQFEHPIAAPLELFLKAPKSEYYTHAVLYSADGHTKIAVVPDPANIQAFANARGEYSQLDFNILYASFGSGGGWMQEVVQDITGERFVPVVFQQTNRQQQVLASETCCVLAAISHALSLVVQDIRPKGHPCMTPRGEYDVDVWIIEI